MKAHIARNQNAGVPLILGWNLSSADRGKLEGMAPAFGMGGGGGTTGRSFGEFRAKATKIRRNYKANFSAGEDCMQKIEVLY